jgi:DNA-binding NarL/FixJ family response regulator
VGLRTARVAAPPAANARSFVLIDDTATLRELLKDAITRRFSPCEVRDFVDGKDGLKSCIQRAPDLLIVDLYLRDTDGREVICELRRHGLQLNVRFFDISSGYAPIRIAVGSLHGASVLRPGEARSAQKCLRRGAKGSLREAGAPRTHEG